MATRRQIAANRRNGESSTGPKTSKGKAKSSMNSLQHGLLARDAVLPCEDRSEFDQSAERLRRELQPVGELESELVRNIVASMWRLKRCGRIEAGILSHFYYKIRFERTQFYADPSADLLEAKLKSQSNLAGDEEQIAECEYQRALETESATMGEAFVQDSKEANALPKLSRYEKSIEQSFYKALHELERLQGARAGKEIPVPLMIDVNVD
jgi:hypothetical protein